jgi:hypothetical protein
MATYLRGRRQTSGFVARIICHYEIAHRAIYRVPGRICAVRDSSEGGLSTSVPRLHAERGALSFFVEKRCLSKPMNQNPMFLDPSSQSNKGRKMLKFFCGLR